MAISNFESFFSRELVNVQMRQKNASKSIITEYGKYVGSPIEYSVSGILEISPKNFFSVTRRSEENDEERSDGNLCVLGEIPWNTILTSVSFNIVERSDNIPQTSMAIHNDGRISKEDWEIITRKGFIGLECFMVPTYSWSANNPNMDTLGDIIHKGVKELAVPDNAFNNEEILVNQRGYPIISQYEETPAQDEEDNDPIRLPPVLASSEIRAEGTTTRVSVLPLTFDTRTTARSYTYPNLSCLCDKEGEIMEYIRENKELMKEIRTNRAFLLARMTRNVTLSNGLTNAENFVIGFTYKYTDCNIDIAI